MVAVAPEVAEELQEAAGVNAPLSLLAESYLQGVEGIELTRELRTELQIRRPQTYGEIRAKEREAFAAQFEETMTARQEAQAESNQRAQAQVQDLLMQSIQVARNSLR